MFSQPVKQMAETEGAMETLKAADQIVWVQRMNNEIQKKRVISRLFGSRPDAGWTKSR